MWFKGGKDQVSIWYVCWGLEGASFNLEGYQTLNGLAKWFTKEAYKEVPVLRVGRMEISKEGVVEAEHWDSREEFLRWASRVVSFTLPEV